MGVVPVSFTHRQLVAIMSGLMLAMFLASLDQTVVATALPTIVGDFHRSDLLSWVVTAYLLTSTTATPLWGKAGDLYGRKHVLQVAIVVFLIGSALCGAAPDMYGLIIFRGLQGIGGGGIIALVFAIVGDVIPPRERGRYQGYLVTSFGLSSVLGPLVGGLIVDHMSWRFIFYLNLPIGAVALGVTNRVLIMARLRRSVHIDWWGALLFVLGISCVLLATQTGGSAFAWTSVQIIGLFGAGALLIVAFVIRERMAPEPILSLALFRIRMFSLANVIAIAAGAAQFGVLAFLPAYLQLTHGSSAMAAGLLLLPMLLGTFASSILTGRFIARTGRFRWFPLSGAVFVTVGLALLSQVRATTSLLVVSGALLVLGLGLGLYGSVLNLIVQNVTPMRLMGTGTSAVTFFRSLGGALGAAVLGAVLSARLRSGPPGLDLHHLIQSPAALDQLRRSDPTVHHQIVVAYAHAIDGVFLASVPVSAISVLAALFVKHVHLRTSNTSPEGQLSGEIAAAEAAGVL